MAESRKHVQVRIAGVNYQLAASENEDYIRALAIQADEMIRRVQQANPYLNQTMSIVLALVNALDEFGQAGYQSSLAIQARDAAERSLLESKTELNRLREQNWDMKKDLLNMQSLLAEFEQHLENMSNPDPEDATPPPIHDYQQSRLEDFI
ncbi:MAG: cell division protein ZapA [Eubacteriales bacterium]|nr:cell division protein ZapA [Eubacteriales bacterium]